MSFEYISNQFQFFLIIVIRLFGMFIVAPFFSSPLISGRIKVILIIGISFIIFPILVSQIKINIPKDLFSYIYLLFNELIIGISIGLIIAIIFGAFQLAGQFFSIQMGFGINEVLDPLSQINVPLVGQFLVLLASYIFFLVEGPILMIEAIYQSFLNLSSFNFILSVKPLMDIILDVFSKMFTIALKISLPIMGTLFIVSLSMGILAKFAPQINILMLGFPIYIIIGFSMLIFLLPLIVENGKLFLEKYLGYIFKFVIILK